MSNLTDQKRTQKAFCPRAILMRALRVTVIFCLAVVAVCLLTGAAAYLIDRFNHS